LTEDERIVIGLDEADDAAVVRLDSGKLLVQTVDFFTPIVDDAYLFGQIAAANSLSDIYAMGAKPIFALNILGFPVNDLPLDLMTQILQGGADKALEAGISVVGGHSIDDKEPKYGLVVTGEVHEKDLVTVKTGKPGDILILTKPLGTGILSTALKKGKISESDMEKALESMAALNKLAAEIMRETGIKTATDVTGFGLLGHLYEMCQASQCGAEIDFSSLSFFPHTLRLAKEKIIPGGTKRNFEHFGKHIEFAKGLDSHVKDLLSDPQTSGGLLLACSPDKADLFMNAFNERSTINACIIGRLTDSSEASISVLH